MSGKDNAKARALTNSLRLTIKAVDRCRELLVNSDADADDLAEYDAARSALRFTLADWLETRSPTPAKKGGDQ